MGAGGRARYHDGVHLGAHRRPVRAGAARRRSVRGRAVGRVSKAEESHDRGAWSGSARWACPTSRWCGRIPRSRSSPCATPRDTCSTCSRSTPEWRRSVSSTRARQVELDAIVIATPTRLHAPMVRPALERGIDVFCEKPLCLTRPRARELAALAAERGLVTQVGYHNRFVGTFREVKRLLDAARSAGSPTPGRGVRPGGAEAEGLDLAQPAGEGGGCLYDYAAHPLNLLSWYLGAPRRSAAPADRMFSARPKTRSSPLCTTPTGSAQLSVNWSDESYRKMTTKMTLGIAGPDLRRPPGDPGLPPRDCDIPDGYRAGWNVRYTTELTEPIWFYLRGEEYSAQLDAFVGAVAGAPTDGRERLRLGGGHRSGDRDDQPTCSSGRPDGRRGRRARVDRCHDA